MSLVFPLLGLVLMLSFQNCGKMTATNGLFTSSASSVLGQAFDVSSAADFNQMATGNTYNLTRDIVLTNQTVPRFMGLTLNGNGHKVSGLTAQCTQATCMINSGRENYIGGLSIYNSTVTDVEFDVSSDISLFPAVESDITAVNFFAINSSTVSNVIVHAILTGTHPFQSGDNRFFVSLLDLNGPSSISNVKMDLTGDVTLPKKMYLGESPVAELWGTGVSNVTLTTNVTYRLGADGTAAHFVSVGSCNSGSANGLNISESASVIASGHSFTSYAEPTVDPVSSSIISSTLRQTFDFVPTSITQLNSLQGFSSTSFITNGTTFSVTHP